MKLNWNKNWSVNKINAFHSFGHQKDRNFLTVQLELQLTLLGLKAITHQIQMTKIINWRQA